MIRSTLDRFRRILIPKKIRDPLGLEPGDVLEIEELKQPQIPMHRDGLWGCPDLSGLEGDTREGILYSDS